MERAGRPLFGALLRQYRLDAGMTQQDLAERAKLSVEAISLLERGARTRPQRETVILLGRALALSSDREALLDSAAGIAHPPRRRIGALNESLLRIVRSDMTAKPGHNLPKQLTTFVGRVREVIEIGAILRQHRLVTVVGAAGVGKTRVATEIGNNVSDECPDGVWLVDLASLSDETLVASTILNAVQLPSTRGSALDDVVAYFKARRLLLIMDNCEHVIAQAREVAAAIVHSCADVRILSTSREALGIAGERAYRLPSLAVPPDPWRTAQEALRYGAVALFVDRALAIDARFALTDDNAPDVAEICRRLDGIPLAIELAAARVEVLAPRLIAQRLDQRFRLLAAENSQALPRHQTMTALIDWSYDLLTAREQTFFESLSVFAGGCTLEAARAICATDGEDELDVIDLITSLVTKSLLVAELAGGEQRYRLLESSRQYARGKLMARGEQELLARRHALVYLELAERLERAWDTTPDREWLRQANVELENWRAALEWALGKRSDVILGQHLSVLRKVVWRNFTLAEGRHWVRAALESVDERTPPDLVARLEHADAEGAQQFNEHKVSLAAAERALLRYREVDDRLGIAQTKSLVGGSLVKLGRLTEAEPLLQEALETARTLGERRLAATTLVKIGWIRTSAGDFAGARDYITEALGLTKVLGAEIGWASAALSLAANEIRAGDPEAALRLQVDALATYRALNSTAPGIAVTLANTAELLIAVGRCDEAGVHASEALELSHKVGLAGTVARSLRYLALVALLRPQIEARRTSAEHACAARLFGFADAHLTTLGTSEEDPTQSQYDRALAILRDAIGSDELMHLTVAGATMTEDQAIVQAHALE